MGLIRNERLFKDFCDFGKAHVKSLDVDPMYWVLPGGYARLGLDKEIAAWFTFLFVAWYHLGNAERVWRKYPEPTKIKKNPGLKFGLDRRNFRGKDNPRVLEHVAAGIDTFGETPWSWAREQAGDGGEEGWKRVFSSFKALPHAGHWAAYKWAKLMKNAFGMSIEAPNVGMASGGRRTGPIPLLVKLTGRPWEQCATDAGLHREVLTEMNARGVPYRGLDNLDCGLCNFNGVTVGRYYLGKNIDAQQGALVGAPSKVFMQARECIPMQYRGELCGWMGLRKDRLVAYRDRRVLHL